MRRGATPPSRKKLITSSVLLLGVGALVVAGITPTETPHGHHRTRGEQDRASTDVELRTGAGRGADGRLKGKELDYVDSVKCRWFAWSAEFPETAVYGSGE